MLFTGLGTVGNYLESDFGRINTPSIATLSRWNIFGLTAIVFDRDPYFYQVTHTIETDKESVIDSFDIHTLADRDNFSNWSKWLKYSAVVHSGRAFYLEKKLNIENEEYIWDTFLCKNKDYRENANAKVLLLTKWSLYNAYKDTTQIVGKDVYQCR